MKEGREEREHLSFRSLDSSQKQMPSAVCSRKKAGGADLPIDGRLQKIWENPLWAYAFEGGRREGRDRVIE